MKGRNLRKQVLCEARRWIGTPYLHQASTCQKGADCLGLIRGVWRRIFGNEPETLPPYSPDWGESETRETLLIAANKWLLKLEPEEARAGDVAIFRWRASSIAKHTGILSGKTSFIHAYEKSGVVETTLGSHWRKRIVATYRFPEKITE